MKFSGKTCLKTILKVTKKQGFTHSLEDTSFEKLQGGGGQIDPPAVLGLNWYPYRDATSVKFEKIVLQKFLKNLPIMVRQ